MVMLEILESNVTVVSGWENVYELLWARMFKVLNNHFRKILVITEFFFSYVVIFMKRCRCNKDLWISSILSTGEANMRTLELGFVKWLSFCLISTIYIRIRLALNEKWLMETCPLDFGSKMGKICHNNKIEGVKGQRQFELKQYRAGTSFQKYL